MSNLGKNIALGIWSKTIDEFTPEDKHYSENLMNYTRVYANQYGYYVKIYPERYDQRLYDRKRIIKYTGEGSYASALNEQGGIVLGRFTHNHIDYIDDVVLKGIKYGLKASGIKRYKISIGMQDGR